MANAGTVYEYLGKPVCVCVFVCMCTRGHVHVCDICRTSLVESKYNGYINQIIDQLQISCLSHSLTKDTL